MTVRERRTTAQANFSSEFVPILTIHDRNPEDIDFFRSVMHPQVYGPISDSTGHLGRSIVLAVGHQSSDDLTDFTFILTKRLKRFEQGEVVDDFEFENVDDQLLRMKKMLPQFAEAEVRAALNFMFNG